MMNEEAIKQLEVTKQCDVDTVSQIKALDMASSALLSVPTAEPLTLEQLREMCWQPVWVETKAGSKFWAIVTGNCVSSGYERYLWIDEDTKYGKTWLAYAYPPAHIDREAWEPCAECSNEYSQKIKAIVERYHGMITETKDLKVYYCPKCGRPLTEEAWDKLEKRMGVRV